MTEQIVKRGWGATLKLLKEYLQMAQQERGARSKLEADHNPEWVRYERETMLDCVNQMRKEDGRTPVALDLVIDAETHASGHSDYTQTFAINCTKLVFDIPVRAAGSW